jgi:hypothetical protein
LNNVIYLENGYYKEFFVDQDFIFNIFEVLRLILYNFNNKKNKKYVFNSTNMDKLSVASNQKKTISHFIKIKDDFKQNIKIATALFLLLSNVLKDYSEQVLEFIQLPQIQLLYNFLIGNDLEHSEFLQISIKNKTLLSSLQFNLFNIILKILRNSNNEKIFDYFINNVSNLELILINSKACSNLRENEIILDLLITWFGLSEYLTDDSKSNENALFKYCQEEHINDLFVHYFESVEKIECDRFQKKLTKFEEEYFCCENENY